MKRLFSRLIHSTTKVEPSELPSCILSFSLILSLMCAYYILRPVRDAMASDWSDAEVSFLWTLNFFVSTAAVALYGMAVKWVPFQRLVPSVYIFFACSFLLFYIGIALFPQHNILCDKAFYLWVSVYSLFNVSVFWSFMSDLFSKEEASRLFPIIGAGASAGALIGPAIPVFFSNILGTEKLLLIASLLLLSSLPILIAVSRFKPSSSKKSQEALKGGRIGGNPFAGFRDFFSDPYLMGIGLFIMLYTAIASIVYFQQKNLLAHYSLDERSQILAGLDWIVNFLTFSIAFFATSRIVKKYGMPSTLSSMPVAMCGGLLILAFSPILIAALFLQIARRAGNYAITRPAREMLFTQVNRESRFKTKAVIDIVAYRGGDMLTSWGFAFMTEGLGFGLGAMAGVGAAVAGLWAVVALYLGRWFEKRD